MINFFTNIITLGKQEQLIGYDPIIALGIVLFVEYVVNKIIFGKIIKKDMPVAAKKIIPIALGGVGYCVFALLTGNVWYIFLIHGIFVGLAAMGSYDALLRKGVELINNFFSWLKDGSKTALEKANEEARKVIDSDK